MNAEEKEKQILDKPEESETLSQEQEANVFFPEKVEVRIKDRVYPIESLKLKQMKLLLRLAKVNLAKIDESAIDTMTDGFSELLHESDKVFLEDNLDMALIREIMLKVRSQTYAGIPVPKGVPKGQ